MLQKRLPKKNSDRIASCESTCDFAISSSRCGILYFYRKQSENFNRQYFLEQYKAKIIYGDLKLADGKSLTISEGTKVYFHKMPI